MSGVSRELFASLNDEEQSAIRNLLCGPTLTLSDEGATAIEVAAAQALLDATTALLRARLVYLLATGGES